MKRDVRRRAWITLTIAMAGVAVVSCATGHPCATHDNEVPELSVRYEPAWFIGEFPRTATDVFRDGHVMHHWTQRDGSTALNCRRLNARQMATLRAIVAGNDLEGQLLRADAQRAMLIYDVSYLLFRIDGVEYFLMSPGDGEPLARFARDFDRYFRAYFARDYRSPFRALYRALLIEGN